MLVMCYIQDIIPYMCMRASKLSGLLPQEHLAGSTVGVLVKCVHLEVMLIGCGSLWFDVRPGRK